MAEVNIAKNVFLSRVARADIPSLGDEAHKGIFIVPVSGYTFSEFEQYVWNANSSLSGIVEALQAYQFSGGGFPFYWPGTYTGGKNYTELRNYALFRDNHLQPYSVSFTLALDQSKATAITDRNGNGFYFYKPANLFYFYIDGRPVTSWSSGYGAPLGFFEEYASICFITSDLHVVYVRLGSNRNNSAYWSGGAAQPDFSGNTGSDYILRWLYSLPDMFDDPYAGGDDVPSENGGGNEGHDATSDPIEFPAVPSVSATDTGFITVFNPTKSQLNSLCNYMWDANLFDVATWQKVMGNPIDAILGLSIVPVDVPNAGARSLTVGNINTGIYMNVATAQFVTVNCGSISVQRYWGSYLDYSPYTKISIFLPYIGIRDLDTDDLMPRGDNSPGIGNLVEVQYSVDIISGQCTAYIKSKGSVLYAFTGQCSAMIPVTGADTEQMVRGAISIATTVVGGIAGSGAAAAGGSAGSLLAGGAAGSANRLAAIGQTTSGIGSVAQNILSMKPRIERSGSYSGAAGMLGPQKPYLIITRPVTCVPNRQAKFIGYPIYAEVELGAHKGFTKVSSVHLEGIPCTEQELSEIEALLKGGVIF